MDEVDLAFVNSLVPEDAIGVDLVAVVAWWNQDAETKRFIVYSAPTMTVENVVGLLELGKARIITDHSNPDD